MPSGQEVTNGSAVAGYQTFEVPKVAQNMLFVTGIATARVTINTLIGAHHLSHVSFLHQSLESGQIGFPEVALGQVLNVEGVTVPLRTAMHSKMLGTGQ